MNRKQVWELTRDVGDLRAGDRLFRHDGRPGVIVTRWISDSELVDLLSDAEYVLLTDTRSTSPNLQVVR